MWNPKYTNQHVYETKPDSDRESRLVAALGGEERQGWEGLRVLGEQVQTAERSHSKVLLYSAELCSTSDKPQWKRI